MQAIAAIVCGALLAAAPPDVPLSLWTSASHPEGLSFGGTMGISFGDYDGDGFIDAFACWSGNLWHNVGGADWQLAGNLSSSLPPTERRYGSSLGDYDNDGFPDIAMAPRVPFWGDDRLHLMHNVDGGVSFVDVAGDPAIVDAQPYGNAETLCWADVNGDGNLDLFVPAYPSWEGGPGNFFLLNEGPAGPGGAYRFVESSEASGLDNPQGTSRPEGAQFVDVDADGDVDLFANGTLYQNVSSSSAAFNALDTGASGIGLPDSLDEGAMFFDYDLDGDFDLVAAYASAGVRIWENRGDGTFFEAEAGIIDEPMTGLNLGMSAEDWDNDGDVDFTTRGVFRRNMLIEEARRHFTVASTAIPPEDISSATPAWGDWDRDGDLDCALGNWGGDGRLYENTTYSPAVAESSKGYLRVRAVRDSRTVARGLETEYGATAEVRVQAGNESFRRRKFVASSHGYLNQNEYTLHFGLPPDAAVDVSVDFPGLSADGPWRVDKSVNPVLAGLDPSALRHRDITVTRCGAVIIDGLVHEPIPLSTPRLTTTTNGLSFPPPGTALAVPNPTTQSDWYAGLDFDTLSATQPQVVKEILLDGQLDAPKGCSTGDRNLALWDLTDAGHPAVVAGGILTHQTSSRNRRSAFPVDIVLAPGRSYRLVARVTEFRPTPIAAPATTGGITVRGGLSFRDQNGCSGQRVAAASSDLTGTALALRFAPLPADSRLDPLGDSLRVSSDAGEPVLLQWTDVSAPGYRIFRCSATGGACTPQRYADSSALAFRDSDGNPQPGELFWYRVNAVSSCAAGI